MAYTIEEEQEINELKAWWKENYKSLVLALILGVGGVSGWNFWQAQQVAKKQELSAQYEQLIYSRQDQTKVDEFVKVNNKTAYATLLLLDQAKKSIDKQDFAQAESQLQEALKQAPDEILSSISALRLATVQFQLGQFDVSLHTLSQVKNATWNSAKALLTGDIQLARGDKAAAKISYEQAKENATALEQQWIQVRLNNL
ncbi:MAG: tetratricopeptide repeat protein [Lonepinella koalarum]|nr:tetratricopeptide repeat protein [Lonepinella koalarum]